MKKVISIICIITLSCQSIAALSWSNLVDKVKPTKKEERVIERNYDVATQSQLHIKNVNGSISIHSWTEPNVHVRATVKAHQDIIQKVVIREKQTDDALALMPTHTDKAHIDLAISVPINVELHIQNESGNITINDAHKAVYVTANKGGIHVNHAHESVALSTHKGNIEVSNIHGKVDCKNEYGNISITDAHSSIQALTQKGNITLSCAEVPSTSSIQLTAGSGSITTFLPPHVNAELEATTKRGAVTCEHYITLKSRTTQLDKNAWQQFKQEVHGILGSGEASVALHAQNGPIAIRTYKTT